MFNTGATVAPGFGLGTLGTAGTPTINGTLQIEINGTAHDQLNVYGNLVLGPTSVLNLPAGNVYDGSTAYIIAAYTGTRTGTFGSTSAIPAGYTLNYGSGHKQLHTVGSGQSIERVAEDRRRLVAYRGQLVGRSRAQ